MNVNQTGSMQQLQMRKMDANGFSKQTGMREIMQELSAEDKNKMIEELSSMSKEERSEKVAKMKELDASAMTREDYTNALFDILKDKESDQSATDGFSIYA